MIRLILISTLLLLGQLSASAAGILDRAAEAFSTSKSLKASFTSVVNGEKNSGTITLQGDKFHLSSKPFSTWYDGTTQWTYVTSSNEVNVTEPTPDELAQVNPFVIISNLRKGYNPASLKSAAGTSTIQLTPKDSRHADIRKAVITFNNSTAFPTRIVLDTASGEKIDITVISITKGKQLPASTFVFNPKNFPRVEIVDLR